MFNSNSKCQLDKVVVLIEKIPLHKTRVSDYGHRMRMIELALKTTRTSIFLDINLNNITINTVLPVLSRLYEDSEYWLITGSDVLKNIANWNKVDELLKVMGLCIVNRNNQQPKTRTSYLLMICRKNSGELDINYFLKYRPMHRLQWCVGRSMIVQNRTYYFQKS